MKIIVILNQMNILTTYEKKPEKIEKKKIAIEQFTDGLCQNKYNH